MGMKKSHNGTYSCEFHLKEKIIFTLEYVSNINLKEGK